MVQLCSSILSILSRTGCLISKVFHHFTMAEVTPTRMFFVGNTVVEERQCGCGVYTKAGSCKPVTISCKLHQLNWFRSTCLTECPYNPHPGSNQAMLNHINPAPKHNSCGRQHSRSDPTQMTESKVLKLVKHEICPRESLLHFRLNHAKHLTGHFQPICADRGQCSPAAPSS